MRIRLISSLAMITALAIATAAAPDKSAPVPGPELAEIKVLVRIGKDAHDPHMDWSGFIPPLCYDPLYIWEPGEGGPVLKPCLAEDWPEYSDDGRTCTIRLRRGARFESPVQGERWDKILPLTVDDVIFTLKRASKYRNFNGYCVLEGVIEGLEEMPAATEDNDLFDWTPDDDAFEVRGLEAVDSRTLRVSLTRPTSLLPLLLAHPNFCVVKRDLLKTNGKFELHEHARSWTSGPLSHHLEQRRRSLVFEWLPGGPLGAATVSLSALSSTDFLKDAIRHLDKGRADFVYIVPKGRSDLPEDEPRHRIVPFEFMYYFAFNMRDEVWGRLDEAGRARRRAVSKTLAREEMAKRWHDKELLDFRVLNDVIPSRQGAAVLSDPAAWAEEDIEADLKLKMKVAIHDSFSDTDIKEFTDALAKIGVAATFARLGLDAMRESIRDCKADAWVLGWLNDSPDPASFLARLRSVEPSAMSDQGMFAGAYGSDEYDKALDALEAIPLDDLYTDKRHAAMARLVAILEKDRPYIPLVELYSHELIAEGIKAPELPVSAGTRLRNLRR